MTGLINLIDLQTFKANISIDTMLRVSLQCTSIIVWEGGGGGAGAILLVASCNRSSFNHRLCGLSVTLPYLFPVPDRVSFLYFTREITNEFILRNKTLIAMRSNH